MTVTMTWCITTCYNENLDGDPQGDELNDNNYDNYEKKLIFSLVLDLQLRCTCCFNPFKYNNTYYGVSAMNTGQEDIERLEQYAMWRGKT